MLSGHLLNLGTILDGKSSFQGILSYVFCNALHSMSTMYGAAEFGVSCVGHAIAYAWSSICSSNVMLHSWCGNAHASGDFVMQGLVASHGITSNAEAAALQQSEHLQHSLGICIFEPSSWPHAAQGPAAGAGAQAAPVHSTRH